MEKDLRREERAAPTSAPAGAGSAASGDALDIEAAHDAIHAMRVRGAAKIGRTAAASLARLATELEGAVSERTGGDEVRERLLAAGRHLIAARPTAVTLRNAVNLTLDGLHEDGAELVPAVIGRAERYIERSHAATDAIARLGADALPDDVVVLTHCHSSLAVASILLAHQQGKRIRAFTDETRPWHQGRITARQLHDAGIDVTFIVDSAAHHIMASEDVDVVLVGADTVTADGALYNKIGTRALACGATSMDIPVICCSGLDKFSPYSLRGEFPVVEERTRHEVLPPEASSAAGLDGVPVRNPVFDRTDGRFIRHYLTEEGAVAPNEVAPAIRQRFGNMEDWL